MRYIYSSFKQVSSSPDSKPTRVSTTTNLNEITLEEVSNPNYVEIYDGLNNKVINYMRSEDELLAWQIAQERTNAWKSKTETLSDVIARYEDKVNPKHYQDYLEGFQWLESMSRIPRYKNNPEAFKGALELQIRKYLDRNGRKDEELQELEKALWYMKFYVAYIKSGCVPLFVNDVDKILAKK